MRSSLTHRAYFARSARTREGSFDEHRPEQTLDRQYSMQAFALSRPTGFLTPGDRVGYCLLTRASLTSAADSQAYWERTNFFRSRSPKYFEWGWAPLLRLLDPDYICSRNPWSHRCSSGGPGGVTGFEVTLRLRRQPVLRQVERGGPEAHDRVRAKESRWESSSRLAKEERLAFRRGSLLHEDGVAGLSQLRASPGLTG